MNEFDRSLYIYTPLFCEENIYKLITAFYTNKRATPIDVILIINPSNSVAVFEQKVSKGHRPVIWDYHVILSAYTEHRMVIFDFDSRCTFPADIQPYFAATFPRQDQLKEKYRSELRCVSAEHYIECFYSDRRHMQGVITEKEFPAYSIIQPHNMKNAINLQNWIDFDYTIQRSKRFTPDEYLLSTGVKI